MKKLVSYFLVLLLVLTLCVSASATSNQYVQDSAGLLTSTEDNRLNTLIAELYEQYGLSLYILTLPSLNSFTIEEYAETYYNSYLSGDAILFIVSMAEREWTFRTFEGATSVVTDWDIDSLMQSVLPTLSAGRYNDSFSILVELVATEYEDYYTVNWPLRIGIAVGIGLVVALIVILIMRSRMKTAKQQHGAKNYMVDGSFDLFRCHDIYLYSHTTRTAKPKNNSSSSGGSRGGRSGSF